MDEVECKWKVDATSREALQRETKRQLTRADWNSPRSREMTPDHDGAKAPDADEHQLVHLFLFLSVR